MRLKLKLIGFLFVMFTFLTSCFTPKKKSIDIQNYYPWCIVAYDSLERSPFERIDMMKELGFNKYAYDWRDRHLDDTAKELKLATENNIDVISVWLWLNTKRDSIDHLSPSNERLFDIVEGVGLKTTYWVSLSENYFKDIDDQEALQKAIGMIKYIASKAEQQDCKVALYNHGGWFGNPYNEIKIIEALPEYNLSLVYNFHHGHHTIDKFTELAKAIAPHLSAVNINGMEKDGEKILCVGQGDYEMEMIQTLRAEGFNGPWGILGHVEGADVKLILENNIEGLNKLEFGPKG